MSSSVPRNLHLFVSIEGTRSSEVRRKRKGGHNWQSHQKDNGNRRLPISVKEEGSIE